MLFPSICSFAEEIVLYHIKFLSYVYYIVKWVGQIFNGIQCPGGVLSNGRGGGGIELPLKTIIQTSTSRHI